MACAKRAPEAVRRALGADRNIPDDQLGDALFDAVVGRRSGALITEHAYDEVWSLISHPDRTIRLAIPSLLEWLARLHPAVADTLRPCPLLVAPGPPRLCTPHANLPRPP